ncbi:MAG: DUF6259 domain-containing protein [Patescibacteria group bacterium]|nr:DUF6259 domain-containing protein [Patescibacteria group bacterium]
MPQWISLSLVLLGIVATAMAEESEVIVVENRVLRLEIARSPAPCIRQLVHKASGQRLLAEPSAGGLFTIVLANKDGTRQTIESRQAGQSSANVEQAGGAGTLSLHYAGFPVEGLAVEVTAQWSPDEPVTHWSMRIENPADRRLALVRFPQLAAVPTIGEGKDDLFVLPALPGTLIENPAENWRNGQSVRLDYPGNLSAQFLTYQDRQAGIYLAGMDPLGYAKALVVQKREGGMHLWHEFVPVADADVPTQWKSPYPVAIGVTQGTWCDSADQYKQWAVRQPWCEKTLDQRDDIPAWWKAGPAVHTVEVRTYDGTRACTGSYYPKLAEHVATYARKLDGPVVAMLAGWENHRRWTAGDYFPLFDEENARRVIAEIKAGGNRPFFFLSGLFFTHWNEGRDESEIPAAKEHLASYVIDQNTGKPAEYVLNESNPSGAWKRHSYQFCAAAPGTTEFFLGIVDRAHELGIDVLQMDQTVSGAAAACYSTEHGHAPGEGLYRTEAFHQLLSAMRQRGKSHTPDFVLFHEEPHEYLIPHLDGFHVREYYAKRWYRGYPGAVGIPLFSYLYHEYALGYGGDSAPLAPHDNRVAVRAHAMNLVAGRTPGGSVWSNQAAMFNAHPDQVAMLRAHSRLLKTRAGEFLMLGRMLHPLELDSPSLALSIPVRVGDKWENQALPTPAVLTSSWQSPAGAIGHLFVNISDVAQPVMVDLDARNAAPPALCDAAICRPQSDDGFQSLWNNASLPKAFALELAPLEVVFVELTPAAPESPN